MSPSSKDTSDDAYPIPTRSQNSSLKLDICLRDLSSNRSFLYMELAGSDLFTARRLPIQELHQASSQPHECSKIGNTSSSRVYRLAKRWIEDCSAHKVCQKDYIISSSQRYRPTRLLRLHRGDGNNSNETDTEPKVQLILLDLLSAQERDEIKYLALSHCWGGAEILSLLPTNIESLKREVPYDQLPLNFQHAIEITLNLGYRYIWIDSLCIIQQDQQDWMTEVPKMGLVYANALLTISATASTTPAGGCFRPMEPFQNECILRFDEGLSLVVKAPKQNADVLSSLFNEKVENAPLTKRGWTFQERYLSKRVLHFCEGDVFFECNMMQASQYHSNGVPYSRRTNIRADGTLHSSARLQRLKEQDKKLVTTTRTERYKEITTRPLSRPAKWRTRTITEVDRNYDFKTRSQKEAELASLSALYGTRGAFQLVLRSSGKEAAENMEFHQCWFELVEQYSTRGLSMHTDKLMAIAGVAAFIQEYSSRIFLAGLWMSTMPFNLLWMRGDDTPPVTRPRRQLPTWSWASIDGVISHGLKMPPLQQMENGSSIERYKTIWREIKYCIDEMDINSVEPLPPRSNLTHNAALRIFCTLIPFDPAVEDGTNFVPDIPLGDISSRRNNSGSGDRVLSGLWWMPVLSFKNHRMGEPGKVHWQGIVVRQKYIPGRVANYERVGFSSKSLDVDDFAAASDKDNLVKVGIRLY